MPIHLETHLRAQRATGRKLLVPYVTGGLLKSVVFGYLIGAVGCYYGMNTTGGTQGVGNATTRAVVTASVLVVFSDFVMTKLIWIFDAMIRSGTI